MPLSTQFGSQLARSGELNQRAGLIRTVNALAAQQDGYVTRDQLTQLGLSRWSVGRWQSSGMLTTAARGVYVVGHEPQHLKARVRLARLAAPVDAILSHGLASQWMDLRSPTSGPLELLVAHGPPRKQPGLIVHSTTHLPPSDVRTTFDVTHTSVSRTLYDLGSTTSAGDLDRMLDRAAKLGTLELIDLHRVLDDRKRLPGRPALVAAIARLGESLGRSRSEFERRTIELCRDGGIGEPISNGIRAGEEVDLSWHWTTGVVELDGFEFHCTPADVAAEENKLANLRAAGVPVMHLSWFDITQRAQDSLARISSFAERHRLPR